jgi:Fic family protein
MADFRTIATIRAGHFTFQMGLDMPGLEVALVRVQDAWEMFKASPLAAVANQLQREVLVQSVFGTNTIEGADLTEEETSDSLDLDPKRVQAEQDIRVRNIKAAYDLAVKSAEDPAWKFSVDYVRAVHAEICKDLPHEDNRPRLFRDNPRERPTVVGNAAHGGVYKPPQLGKDIVALMNGLIEWHDSMVADGVPALIRAPLIHLYYELIHPFWDGNGRVGRVLEATLLRQAGFKYAPFALAKYYQEEIHEYFTLFNKCRKEADKGLNAPNQAFVLFHLEGLRKIIVRLNGRVAIIAKQLLFETVARDHFENKKMNQRQYGIVKSILDHGKPLPLSTLRADPRYKAMYASKTDKTRQRDLRKLLDTKLIVLDNDGVLWPKFAADPEPPQPNAK